MLAWLKSHPFAVEAFFEHSLVLTFAVPKAELAVLLPAPLVPDSFDDDWGFLAVPWSKPGSCGPKASRRGWGRTSF